MLADVNIILSKIVEIEHKYALYFRDKDFKLRHCVKVVWDNPLRLKLNNKHELPFQIACEVEELFSEEIEDVDKLEYIMNEIKVEQSHYHSKKERFNSLCDSLCQTMEKRTELMQRIHSA